MDLCDSPSEEAFRKEARAFLEQHAEETPGELLDGEGEWEESLAASKAWQRLLYDNGWAAITWPKEYGGQGCGPRRADHLEPGVRPRQVPVLGQHRGHRDGRTGAHRPRHRRAT
ncbi:MAG: acyl-CoA dehydrogenase family protein [Microthrixaceae bacterium]|nr:acyl-CoA dehydrogenase family protein [Microthrixaceae bacterium]